MRNHYHKFCAGVLGFVLLGFCVPVYAQTEEELRMQNECRDDEHKVIRQENLQRKQGGPVDEAERERIIHSLYKAGKLYKSQRPVLKSGKTQASGDVLPAPVPLGTEHTFGNGKLKGSWMINKITNNQDGVRLDRTVYDPEANHIYAVNTVGHLVDGDMVPDGSLLRRNQKIVIQEKGFTGLRCATGKFRLIAAMNPTSWTAGAFYYSDDDGMTWTESTGGEYSSTKVVWSDVMADNSVLIIVGRIVNGVDSQVLLRSTDDGTTYSIVQSWPDSETARVVATKLYNTDDGCVILRKIKSVQTTEVYHYQNATLSLKSTISHSKVPATITGTNFNGWKVYVGADGEGGFYSADGINYEFVATMNKDLETVVPYNPNMVFSREPQHDYTNNGGLTWQKYPNNNGTVGWDPKHLTFYKKTDGKWYFVIANDMGLSFSTSTTDPLNQTWNYVNDNHSYAILHGGVADDKSGLVITSNQDPGTFELKQTGVGTFNATKRRGADGLRVAIANGGKAFWYRHYWAQMYHRHAASVGNTEEITVGIPTNNDWYTPPFKGSTKPNEDAIYVSGYGKLKKFTYNPTTNKVTKLDLPYNFGTLAGDSTIGVGVAASDPNRIYVATKNKRFFTSKDAGQTWTETTYTGTTPNYNTPLYNQSGGYFIEVADTNPDLVFWGGGSNTAACLVSRDGGVTFSPMLTGMPSGETIRNIALNEDASVIFSTNLYFYLASTNQWYAMRGESLPAGLNLQKDIKGISYLPSQKKVRYFTWGAGMMDFNISVLDTKPVPPTNVATFTATLTTEANKTDEIQLNWKAVLEAEPTVQSFIVQRSLDGVTFTDVDTVGMTNASDYFFTDKVTNTTSQELTVYYRLEIKGVDGPTVYSKVETVKIVGAVTAIEKFLTNGGTVSFAPNPVNDRLNVKLENLNTSATITIWTLSGKKYTSVHIPKSGSKTVVLQTSMLPSGLYILHLQTDKESIQTKFIKE